MYCYTKDVVLSDFKLNMHATALFILATLTMSMYSAALLLKNRLAGQNKSTFAVSNMS